MHQGDGDRQSHRAVASTIHKDITLTGGMYVEKKHSGLGIASFIISMAVGILMLLLFAVAGVMETSTPGGIDESSVGAMLVGLFLIGFLFLDVIALGLGIAGLTQSHRNRIFAILGMVFASSTMIITLFLMLLGFAME